MQVISTSFNMLLIPFTWSLVLKSVIILFAVFCSVLRRSNASWLPQRFLRLRHAARGRLARLTSQGPLLLLFSLALFASFRYETFLTPLNLMNIMRQNSCRDHGAGHDRRDPERGSISVGALAVSGRRRSNARRTGEPRGNRRRHCKRTLLGVVNGLLVSRARLQPFVVTLFTASAARGWRASPRRVDCRIIGASGLVWLGRGSGPIPVPVLMVALLYFAAWFMLHRSLLVAHVRGRRQRGGSGSWA